MSQNCLFCKIVSGEFKTQTIFENENVVGFVDIHPQAKIHLLFIHKKHTANINEMSQDPEALAQLFQGITEYTNGHSLGFSGFRVVTNLGPDACQSVFHTHFHVLGGEPLGHFGRR